MMNSLNFKNLIIIIACGIVHTAWCQLTEIQLAQEYWNKGEREKAYQTYKQLARNQDNLQTIHAAYFNVLLELKKFGEAHDHANRIAKKFPNDPAYRLDDGMVWLKQGDLARAEKIFTENMQSLASQQSMLKSVSDYFLSKGLPEYAEQALLMARKNPETENIFSLELANVYRLRGKKENMVEEYLSYVSQVPSNASYVRNLLSMFLTRPEDQDLLQQALYSRVQRFPDAEMYADLLIWSLLQQKNFDGALIQSKAYDRRFGQGSPLKTYELAQIATNNKDYDVAARAYDFIVRSFQNSEQYLPSRLGILRSTEQMLIGRFPVNKDSLRELVRQYDFFAREYDQTLACFEARIQQARLQAFYLDRLDSAVLILDDLIQAPRANPQLKSRARLELGDIYLIRGEYWESTLVYSQVEKSQKDTPIAHEAKFRNARLSYFKGDFRIAEEHLDVLKQATSREISNDAIQLSLRIKENTMTDTLGRALSAYAWCELLLQQNRTPEVIAILPVLYSTDQEVTLANGEVLRKFLTERGFTEKSLTKDSIRWQLPEGFSTPSIRDDVYWLEAGLHRKAGKPARSIELLLKIMAEYPTDVLADDAAFLQAEITERDLRQTDSAKDLYRDFLTKYPGSVYAAEARKRFRMLRGDFQGSPESN